jgi:radical SAM protein with 4Fe4S-binding SPASM domain
MRIHSQDVLHLIRKLTPRRVFNFSKVLASYYYSRLLGKPRQWGLPVTLSIEPTTACNLRCPECPSGLRQFTRPTGNLKHDFFRRIADELSPDLLFLIFYFQGEPYINPDFLSMVRYAADKGLYTITSTNGHFLNDDNARRTVESGLSRLVISIDGATQEVYEQYRKEGKLESVLQGARNVVKWKRQLRSATPHIVFQFLVVRPNEHQIETVRALAQEIGVDELKLKTAQLYDYKHGNPLMPLNERYSRYAKQPNGEYAPRHALLNHCWKLWHASVVTWDGRVVPCCFDKDAAHEMGALSQTSFRELWKGKAYQKFRETLFTGRQNINICTNCTEGCKVWVKPA